MTNTEIKQLIAARVAEGVSLSKIQDELQSEHQVKMTFFELRLLASEIENADWSKLDKPEKKAPAPAPAEPEDAALPEENEALPEEGTLPPGLPPEMPAEKPAAEQKVRGKTTVEVSKLMKPGTLVNGSVTFGSGSRADWYLDQMGRLGLSNLVGEQPDETDIAEFQQELRTLLGA